MEKKSHRRRFTKNAIMATIVASMNIVFPLNTIFLSATTVYPTNVCTNVCDNETTTTDSNVSTTHSIATTTTSVISFTTETTTMANVLFVNTEHYLSSIANICSNIPNIKSIADDLEANIKVIKSSIITSEEIETQAQKNAKISASGENAELSKTADSTTTQNFDDVSNISDSSNSVEEKYTVNDGDETVNTQFEDVETASDYVEDELTETTSSDYTESTLEETLPEDFEEDSEEIVQEDSEITVTSSSWDGPVLTAFAGTVEGPSGKETYYNLDMTNVISIMRSYGYDGEYWVRDDGVKMLGDYIMCAANLDIRPRGTYIETSLGMAIVCDTGGFAYSNPYQLDIAVTW